jgi:glycosyltransferase involved in cell wall biosynthesis
MFGKKRLNVAFVGNYLPRICGIATFTKDICESVSKNLSSSSNVFAIAVNDNNKTYDYPKKVIGTINQETQKDYIDAANIINTSNAEVLCLQHEYGIYGGWDGAYIMSLLSRINIPVVTTLHTVLMSPSPNQKKIMTEIASRSEKVVVMSKKAVDFLTDIYGVNREKIELILHGTPDFPSIDSSHFKKRFKLEGRKMLLTFGLLSPNKGIETVLNALPEVIEQFPDMTYVVLGKTHPNVLKEQGEKYRMQLMKLSEKLGLSSNVIFDNRFVSIEELKAWLSASDIYITPYMNKAQIVSGTLSYAISAGNAVISTPYWHAKETLGDGTGVLFDFNDHRGLATVLKGLLADEKKLEEMQKKAFNFGKQTTWKKVSRKYIETLNSASQKRPKERLAYAKSSALMRLPEFDLTHVKRLTDDTGIIQHSKYIVPDRSTGYCLDDNARALMAVTWAFSLLKSDDAKRLLSVYCSFMNFMQKEDGRFRNFMDYNRNFMDQDGSDDSNGRTIWACGFIIWKSPNESYRSMASECFRKTFGNIPKLNLRGKAFAILGLCAYLRAYQNDEKAFVLLKECSKHLLEAYGRQRKNDWHWFEDILCYDNAVMPMALFNAYQHLKEESVLKTAVESLAFLEKLTFRNGKMSVIGNDGWYRKGHNKAQFDQQPIDAAAMVMAMQSAYRATRDKEYLTRMKEAFDWFMGENDLGMPLYDIETKGCADGLHKSGVSMNQGAESTISFLLALLAMIEEYEIESLE